MNEKSSALPKAQIGKSHLSWFLWLIPVAAALVCGWFVAQDFIFAGPTITIYFENADGLQEQNSLVEYRGVKVGEVGTLKLSNDRQRVAVKVQLDASAANIARQGSVFWIVRPEVKLGALSGLQTIVSGNYITVQPGDGPRTNQFIGVEKAPIEPVKALDILLHRAETRFIAAAIANFLSRKFRWAKCWIAGWATTPAKSSSTPALRRICSAGADEFKILECRRH